MEQGVSFGDYRFELETGRLWSGSAGGPPHAEGVRRAERCWWRTPEQPVSKEDLFATVWSDTAVSDDALTSCIQELRRALADDAKQPRFIETRHRRGYRFVAQLVGDGGRERRPPAHRRQRTTSPPSLFFRSRT